MSGGVALYWNFILFQILDDALPRVSRFYDTVPIAVQACLTNPTIPSNSLATVPSTIIAVHPAFAEKTGTLILGHHGWPSVVRIE